MSDYLAAFLSMLLDPNNTAELLLLALCATLVGICVVVLVYHSRLPRPRSERGQYKHMASVTRVREGAR
jgi:hypothetical protein